ncbi:MAG TPA: flagellar biosynthetic protein FliR [Bryobacteraceae bacterium]|nr:flagellar biosynthetic protein FliR [Bryobacteraceae bacterium]
MRADPGMLPMLFGFLLTLARVSGVMALVPLPGLQAAPKIARIVLSVVLTLVLSPSWPAVGSTQPDVARLLLWLLPEIGIGVTVGLAVAFILEAFVTGAQILSLNAGFSFAQTIDPTTQAESGVLLVFAQLAGGLIFLALGLDREVVRALAYSLEAHPAGAWLTAPAAAAVLRLGGDMLSLAARLAMPGIALLILVDVALGLLGRLNAQLQLLTLAFPIKMVAGLILLAWITLLLPKLMPAFAGTAFGTLRRIWHL